MLVVFIGVTAGFILNNWQQDKISINNLISREFVNSKDYQNLEFTNMYLAAFTLLQQNNAVYEQALIRNNELAFALNKETKNFN